MAAHGEGGGAVGPEGAAAQDILRLSARQTAAILDWMDVRTTPHAGQERRRWPRVEYRSMPRVGVLLENERKGRRMYALAPRNLSRMGIALLHGKFVYGGTKCVVGLPARNCQVVPVRGKVIWCRLVTGRVHELGVELDEAIELREFVEEKAAA